MIIDPTVRSELTGLKFNKFDDTREQATTSWNLITQHGGHIKMRWACREICESKRVKISPENNEDDFIISNHLHFKKSINCEKILLITNDNGMIRKAEPLKIRTARLLPFLNRI